MALPQLHHRPEYADIRSAYDSDRSWHSDYASDFSYHNSQASSYNSYQTQPTVYSTGSSKHAPRVYHGVYDDDEFGPASRYFADRQPQESPRSSVETYASTIQSEQDLPLEDTIPEYDVPQYANSPYAPRAIPATPSDFSELFPSHRRLTIRHDDSTLDGNMNLRLDTEIAMHGGRRCDMTLFHLRMHDLRNREFSLRRYCRDSGREVCHSLRKTQKTSCSGRPSLQRSLSNALSTIRVKSEQKGPPPSSLKRNDSGYGSAQSSIDWDRDDRPVSASGTPKAAQPFDPNSIKLEFSNYAQLEVRRAGVKVTKRYEFEYWGSHYSWRRVVEKDSTCRSVSYHLTKAGCDKVLAYITPLPLTRDQIEAERRKGGWVPPCSIWIADVGLVRGQKDVADVVIASGLIALVDDSIRTWFHSKESQQLMVPKFSLDVEHLGPKRLINEMFKRESSSRSRHSSISRPSSSRRG